jgi:hypothetical protein
MLRMVLDKRQTLLNHLLHGDTYLGTHDENVGENVQVLEGSWTTKTFPSATALALIKLRQLAHISFDTANVSDNKDSWGSACEANNVA